MFYIMKALLATSSFANFRTPFIILVRNEPFAALATMNLFSMLDQVYFLMDQSLQLHALMLLKKHNHIVCVHVRIIFTKVDIKVDEF